MPNGFQYIYRQDLLPRQTSSSPDRFVTVWEATLLLSIYSCGRLSQSLSLSYSTFLSASSCLLMTVPSHRSQLSFCASPETCQTSGFLSVGLKVCYYRFWSKFSQLVLHNGLWRVLLIDQLISIVLKDLFVIVVLGEVIIFFKLLFYSYSILESKEICVYLEFLLYINVLELFLILPVVPFAI